jgi:hypothetical protein
MELKAREELGCLDREPPAGAPLPHPHSIPSSRNCWAMTTTIVEDCNNVCVLRLALKYRFAVN